MGIRNFPVITIQTDGSVVEVCAAAGSVAIPTLVNTGQPKFLHIRAFNDAAAALLDDFISVTPDIAANSGAFATGFVLSTYYCQEIILNVHGYDFIGYDISSGSPVTSSIQMTPLADF